MSKRLLLAILTVGLLVAMLPSAALAGKTVDYGWGAGPNQGQASKVILLEKGGESCCNPVPSRKYEGNYGRYKVIRTDAPIYGVSVKSGRDAEFRILDFGQGGGRYWIAIHGSKDISNFVVWTCPCVCGAS